MTPSRGSAIVDRLQDSLSKYIQFCDMGNSSANIVLAGKSHLSQDVTSHIGRNIPSNPGTTPATARCMTESRGAHLPQLKPQNSTGEGYAQARLALNLRIVALNDGCGSPFAREKTCRTNKIPYAHFGDRV